MAVTNTVGRALLRAVLAKHGVRPVARAVGLSEDALRTARVGDTRPRPAARKKLAELYAIPVDAWEKRAPKRAPTPLPPVLLAPAAPDHADPRANMTETLRMLRERLASAGPEDNQLVTQLSRAIAQSSKLLADLSGEFELTPAMVLRSAPWREVKLALVDALAVVPGALEAMAGALRALEAG